MLTFQILEGMERGRVLEGLRPPITIGREEDNAIQLNDERVSRFHAKIQENGDRIILTDLESTNGTRVNGHAAKMHVLQIGDHISVGRCLLLYGSPAEIEANIKQRSVEEGINGTVSYDSGEFSFSGTSAQDADEEVPRMFPGGAPELPSELRPLQVAQMSDLLAHIHDRMQSIANAGRAQILESKQGPIIMDWAVWQRLLKLEMDVATYLRKLTEPSDGEDEFA